jgi:hypothetical protein
MLHIGGGSMSGLTENSPRETAEVPPGHPIYILLKEHELVKGFVARISQLLSQIELAADIAEIKGELSTIGELLKHLREYEKHKVREENSLFPYLEKHGVTQPPAIMWTEHDEQRRQIKEASKILETVADLAAVELRKNLLPPLKSLVDLIPKHFYKEENILFPMALKLISEDEWREIRASMDELGYCCFTPEEAIGGEIILAKETNPAEGRVVFETGSLTREELEALLNTLPVDITFVAL